MWGGGWDRRIIGYLIEGGRDEKKSKSKETMEGFKEKDLEETLPLVMTNQ